LTAAALIALPLGALGQATGRVIAADGFEDQVGAWAATDGTGRVSITHETADVKSGKGALKFEYAVGKGEVTALMRQVDQAPPPDLKSIRFWVKSPSRALLAVVLQEREGGRYVSPAFVPAGKWQKVELALSDFALSKETGDPPDPDNKLDVDQISAIGMADMVQLLAQIGGGELMELLGVKPGPRVLVLDDLEATSEALPAPPAKPGEVVVDAFLRPHLAWFVTGIVECELVTGQPLDARSIRLDFPVEQGKIAAAVRMMPQGCLASASKLLLRAASEKPTTLFVQVEEASGGKYNGFVALDGARKPTDVTLAFSSLQPSDDSKDTNGKLDLDQVKQLVFADGGFATGGTGRNTVWLSDIRGGR